MIATKIKTEEIKEFAPVFLYTDEGYKKEYLRLYDKSIDDLNSLIKESERITKRKFTDKEKKAVSTDGIQSVITEVRDSFQFKDATEDFNLSALGVNFKEIEKLSFTYKNIRTKYEYVLKNGLFERYHKEIDIIKNASDVYTSKEKQNAKLIYINQLVKVFKEALKSETLSQYDLIDLVHMINGLALHLNDNGKGYYPVVKTSTIHSMAY